jgi:hypothetical protein
MRGIFTAMDGNYVEVIKRELYPTLAASIIVQYVDPSCSLFETGPEGIYLAACLLFWNHSVIQYSPFTFPILLSQ